MRHPVLRAVADSYLAISRERRAASVWPEYRQTDQVGRNTRLDRLESQLADKRLDQLSDAGDLLLRDNLREVMAAAREGRVCRRELWSSLGQVGGWQLTAVNWARQQTSAQALPSREARRTLAEFPAIIAAHQALLQRGMQEGYLASVSVVDAVVAQLDRLVPVDSLSSPLIGPLRTRTAEPAAAEWIALVLDSVYPAVRQYRAFLVDSYRPRARLEGSLATLPRGRECYAAWLREQTSISVDLERQMTEARAGYARALTEMTPLVRRLTGASDVVEGIRQLRSGQAFAYPHRDSILPAFRALAAVARARLSRVVTGVTPDSLTILPYGELEEKADLPPRYLAARADRPAQFLVNLGRRDRMSAAAAVAHEGYPGHHLQFVAARQATATHPIMSELSFGSFNEGWGIYAEELGDEMGLYDSDLYRVGYLIHLSDVYSAFYFDVGFHARGWSRQMLVDSMMQLAGRTRANAEAYADRHAATPGQLATYYVGWQAIRDARASAAKRLGDRFDLPAFNHEVIRDGSISLASLRAKLAHWRQPAAGASAAPAVDSARWRSLLLEEMERTKTPGAAMAVLVNGKVAYATAAGVRSIESREPMTVETLVRTGSVTKMITGLTAARMAAAGRLSLARPIGLSARGLSPALAGLTLRDLLMHRAGLINEGLVDGRHDDGALGTRMRSWGREMVFGPPGDVFSYSSPGYWLSGYLLEQAGRKPYADVVTEWLLRPLGMMRSTFRPTMALTWPLALDHRVAGDSVTLLRPFQDDASSWPSGGLFSNVLELARVAQALLANGMSDGVRVIPEGTVQELAALPMVTEGSDCGYAYGLSKCRRGSSYTLGHYGFRVGSGAVFTLLPERGVGVIILANRGGGIFRDTEERILGELAPVPAEPEPQAEQGVATGVKVASVAGRYVAGVDTLLLLTRRDSLFYRYGGESFPARVIGKDRIAVYDTAGTLQQEFRLVRGAKSGRRYLHDGLNAYREMR